MAFSLHSMKRHALQADSNLHVRKKSSSQPLQQQEAD